MEPEGARSLEVETQELFVTTLQKAIELHDKDTWIHCSQVAGQALRFGQKLGLAGQDLADLNAGASLHDLGKLGIPDYILLKPGPLTGPEREIMRQHPDLGAQLLKDVPFLQGVVPIIQSHHENWDGTGYPQGLKGEEIPRLARIVSLVSVWNAMANETHYRQGWLEPKLVDYLRSQSGRMFDPGLVEAFIELLSEPPAQQI